MPVYFSQSSCGIERKFPEFSPLDPDVLIPGFLEGFLLTFRDYVQRCNHG
jgi:hypothetical protein